MIEQRLQRLEANAATNAHALAIVNQRLDWLLRNFGAEASSDALAELDVLELSMIVDIADHGNARDSYVAHEALAERGFGPVPDYPPADLVRDDR